MTEPLVERPDMTAYGVPRGPEGALAWSWAEERLVRCRNYWVATADASGRPHAMPVWGVWRSSADGPDSFWFSCAPTARRAANLAVNPRLVVAVDDTVEVVSVEGVARCVPGTDPHVAAAIDSYVAKYWPGEDPEPHAGFLRSHVIYSVTPLVAFGIIEREDEFAAKATRWRWA